MEYFFLAKRIEIMLLQDLLYKHNILTRSNFKKIYSSCQVAEGDLDKF